MPIHNIMKIEAFVDRWAAHHRDSLCRACRQILGSSFATLLSSILRRSRLSSLRPGAGHARANAPSRRSEERRGRMGVLTESRLATGPPQITSRAAFGGDLAVAQDIEAVLAVAPAVIAQGRGSAAERGGASTTAAIH